MKHAEWSPKKRIEAEYLQSINRLFGGFFSKIEDAGLSPEILMAAFRAYCQNGNFKAWVQAAASRMVTGLAVQNAKTWRAAAMEGTQGRMIHAELQRELSGPIGIRMRMLVSENARLISSLPDDIAQSVNNFIREQAMKGARSYEIGQAISYRPDIVQIRERFEHLTKTRIALIARTETSKASTALTRSRSESLGIPFYVWRTSKDGRVRSSHQHMEGVIIPWSDAPSPEALKKERSVGNYHAGEIYNCRCYPAPVINLNYVKWPAKVYSDGTIKHMTRSAFEKMAGIETVRRAA